MPKYKAMEGHKEGRMHKSFPRPNAPIPQPDRESFDQSNIPGGEPGQAGQ